MFKNLIFYTFRLAEMGDSFALEADLERYPFIPTGPTQQLSTGWVPPRGADHGDMVVRSGHRHWLLKLAIEQRAVPGKTLEKRVDEMAKAIMGQTGRNVGKKQRKELKEEALLELLPRAFPRRVDVAVWIDAQAGILAIDTSSVSRAELVIEALSLASEGLALEPLSSSAFPSPAMAAWLSSAEQPPGELEIGNECELKSHDGACPAVSYKNHELNPGAMKEHIDDGKTPTKLALTFDGRVSFVLTEAAHMRKIQILDGKAIGVSKDEQADAFDASLALATGELSRAIEGLIAALIWSHPDGTDAQLKEAA